MSLARHYPEFGTLSRPHSVAVPDVPDPEEAARLAIFDEGFQAGWDDATRALRDDAQDAMSEISQRLQDMSFTLEEARVSLLQTQVPVLTQIFGKLLPAAADAALAVHLQEQIDNLLTGELDQSITISVAPQSLETMESCLRSVIARPFRLVSDPLLEPGQVTLGAGGREREINLDHMVEEILAAIKAYSNTAKEAQENE